MTEGRQEFLMPSLGADMDSGSVAEWLVRPGDRIRKGEVIAVVDTDKALIEAESFHTGVVEELLVPAGERVPVGTALAVIASAPVELVPPESAPAAPVPPESAPAVSVGPVPPESALAGAGVPDAEHRKAGPRRRAPAEGGPEPARPEAPPPVISPIVRHLAERHGVDLGNVHGTGPGGRVTREDVELAGPVEPAVRVKASPLARGLARELGIDLAGVHGTGRTGAIRADDVRAKAAHGRREGLREEPRKGARKESRRGSGEKAGAQEPTRAAAEREVPAAGQPGGASRQDAMRRAIARAMARANREIPHYYLSETVDMGAALAWLRGRNRDLPVARRLLPAVLLLKAAARAAREVPELNGFWLDDAFVPGEAVHLGVAISLRGGGLIAPALHDAADRDLDELMAALKDLVTRARTGRLRGAEMTEATITVTNLGDQGVEAVHGVIHPPQVALVGFGRILERPWAVGGLLGVRPLVTTTLAADHRATDGYTGGRFLTAVGRLLDHPEEL